MFVAPIYRLVFLSLLDVPIAAFRFRSHSDNNVMREPPLEMGRTVLLNSRLGFCSMRLPLPSHNGTTYSSLVHHVFCSRASNKARYGAGCGLGIRLLPIKLTAVRPTEPRCATTFIVHIFQDLIIHLQTTCQHQRLVNRITVGRPVYHHLPRTHKHTDHRTGHREEKKDGGLMLPIIFGSVICDVDSNFLLP